MSKALGLAALVAATAGVVLPLAPASAVNHCQYVEAVAGQYRDLDEKANDALPDVVWTCTD